MSTVSSGNAAKGEKGKKYQSLNINSIFKVSGSESQQKSAAPKHGLQVLGKVPAGRRVPNPVHLPSLKSESGGQDPNVVLVPANSSGWVSGSEVKNGSVPTGNAAQPAVQSQTESKTAQPLASPVKQQPVLKPQVPQAPPPGAPSANRGPPIPIPGQLRPGGGQLPSSRPVAHYDRQFPTLGGEQGKAAPDAGADQKQGPSLRPQSEGTWAQPVRAPPSEPQRYPNLGPVPEPEMAPPLQMAQGQGRQMPPMMHYPRGMPPPYMRPPPLGQFPPHFQMRNARPPMRGPPPLRETRQVSGEDVALAPILKQEELNKLDEIAREGGWAAEQDEIDYNQKLTFSDDEDHPRSSSTRKEDSEAKVVRDAKWAESIQPQGKLIQQAKVQPNETERNDHRSPAEVEKAALDEDEEWNERRRQQHDQESEIAERARRRRYEEEMRWRKERESMSSSGASPRVSESRDYPSDRDHPRDYPQEVQRRDADLRDYSEGKDYASRHDADREHARDSKDYGRKDAERDYRSRDNKDSRRDVEGKDYRQRDWDYAPRQDYPRRDDVRDRDYPRSGDQRRKDDWDREEYRDYGYPPSRDSRTYQRAHGSSNLPPRLQKQQEMRRQDSGSLAAPPQHTDRYSAPAGNKSGRPARSELDYNRDYDRDLERRPPSREQRLVRRQDSEKDERRNREEKEYESSFADDSRPDSSRYDQRGYDRSFQRGDDYDEYGRSSRSSRYSDDSKRGYDRGGRVPERERPYYEREVSNDTQPESFDSREPEEIPSWADDSSDSPPPPIRHDDVKPVEEKPTGRDEESRVEETLKVAEKEQEEPKLKELVKEQEAQKPTPKEEPVKPVAKPVEPVAPREPTKRAEVSREPRPKLVVAKEDPPPKVGEKKEEDFARPRTWGGHSYKEERKHKGHAPLPISRERVEADIDNVLKQSIASQRKEKEPEKVKIEEISPLVEAAPKTPQEVEEPTQVKEETAETSASEIKPSEVKEEPVPEVVAEGAEPSKVAEKVDEKSSRGGRGRTRDYDNRNKDYRTYDQRGRGNRPYSQSAGRGRNEYRGGRGGRYYYDDWDGDYDYSRKRENTKGEFRDKKAGRGEEKEVKDEKKETENADTQRKENVEEREEPEQERKSSGRGWESRGSGRGGRGVNTRGRGSYGPPGSRPFSGENEGSKDNRAPRFQKIDSSQRGRGAVGRKAPNVPPPFSDKKAEEATETTEESSHASKEEEEKREVTKEEKQEVTGEVTEKVESQKKEDLKTEESSDATKEGSQEDKAAKKKEEVPKKEFSRPQRERRDRRDDRRKDDYRDRRDDNRERRDDQRERRDDRERRERADKDNKSEKKEENKENTGEPHGKKHKDWDPSSGDEEKAKKPRKEEKPAQRPIRERRDSGRSAKAGYQRDTRHTTLPPRFAKLQAQRQKGFSDGSSPSGFGPQPPASQPGGIAKVDLNPPPPPPVNAWAKPITETLKQHAAAQQQTLPISQAPPQAPPTSVPPPFAPPQRRGEPVKVGQTLQSKPAEPAEPPTSAPAPITGSLVFENTKIKAKSDSQTEPIQLPFALSKPSEDLQLDFTFDASLHTEEKRAEPAPSANPVGAKANVNLNLQRNIVASVQSPISPSTADLNLKIQSVKKVWDTMPTVVEHSGEEPAVSTSGPFGNAFGSPTNISSTTHVQGSEIADAATEEFTGNQAGYVGGSSPAGKTETTAAKSKQQPSPPPTFGQHYTSVSSQANVLTQYQQYNAMPAIPSPPTTVLYSPANPQQMAGQQLLTQYQIDGTTVPISMQILNASSQATSRSVSAQYSAAQAYNLPVMSPNLNQFGSSGFSQQSILVPPPNGGPLGTGSGQPTPPSGPEAVFGAQHVRVQTASYGQTSPSPNATAVIIPGNKTATAQFGMGVGAQQGFGNIGKPFQQHPGSGTAQLQNPFYIYEQTPVIGHLPANFMATPVLRNNLPPGPPPSGPTSFYSTTSTPAQSPFFQGQGGAQIQPPPSMNQAAGSFGGNQSFSLQGFSSHTPTNLQGFGRNQNQMSRTAPVNYPNIGLYKVLTTAPDQLKQMAALGTNENLASQYLSSQGSIQLSTNGGVLTSQNQGIQQPLSSPKSKDQRSNGVNGNRYGNGSSGFGAQTGSFKQNANVYTRQPAPVAYPHQQVQSRFPAPIQRPAVSQAGGNQKSGKAMIGQGGGVSPAETFTSQGNGPLKEKLASEGNQELIPRSASEETLKKQTNAETHAEPASKLEVNEVK